MQDEAIFLDFSSLLTPTKKGSRRSMKLNSVRSVPAPGARDASPRRAVRSVHAPSVNQARKRSCAIAQKYLCAFLYANDRLRYAVTHGTSLLNCARLVSIQKTQATHRRIEWAIGGRFSRTCRLLYLTLKYDYQSDLGRLDLNLVLVYLTEPHVLAAIEDHLCWLDKLDGGDPLSQNTAVDYFQVLRAKHPVLADGHEYAIRYTAITRSTLPVAVYRPLTVHESPFTTLPTCTTFANPLFHYHKCAGAPRIQVPLPRLERVEQNAGHPGLGVLDRKRAESRTPQGGSG
ncbi:hypothetical protein B0H11DRAFT_1262423 [Mycena galericulata]|nr:hypothetical protein B0H11DRAFT_1262423 [Mycena galericulata]